uniref:Uncharacterized protein n=1 Tax=Tolypiocladia glomerulata TaxID=860646 RepID=A0A1Z1MV88_9FLOR|nr:hypothetical protein [Tolypiocladia glomerulata]ARW69771.1 hypothetical protein [Tolypiocladia glomerulata]
MRQLIKLFAYYISVQYFVSSEFLLFCSSIIIYSFEV